MKACTWHGICWRNSIKKGSIKKNPIFPPAAVQLTGTAAIFPREVVRKSLHFLIALVPALAVLNYSFTIFLLSAGILVYSVMEFLRLKGINVPLVSAITVMASRQKEHDHFVFGPVTLAFGALFTLLLFPFPIAAIGIYALAFGDGFAGLIGKLGSIRPFFLFGKSIEGSLACFTATFISAWLVSHNIILSLAAAFTSASVEALPLKDYDNIVLPLAVGLVVMLF